MPPPGCPPGSLQAPVLFAFSKVKIVTTKTTQPVLSLGICLHSLAFPSLPPFFMIGLPMELGLVSNF